MRRYFINGKRNVLVPVIVRWDIDGPSERRRESQKIASPRNKFMLLVLKDKTMAANLDLVII